jgi:hypothetical protein
MILVDLSQVLLGGIMAQITGDKKVKIEEDLIRHMVLNTIRLNLKAFKAEYGEVVLCCDSRKYWRRDIFPFYKANRKKMREKSDLDWQLIYEIINKLKIELKENFPYKVIDIDGAEADDIIGVLTPRKAPHEKILILSSDGDFLQLQKYPSVKQYNPALKKYVKSANPAQELKEKIIRGDKGDGIPNMFSPSDCFVRDIRQKPVTQKVLEKYLYESVDEWNEEDKVNFSRNQTLIDLTFIPNDIAEKIINTYEETVPASRKKILTYFIEKRLKNLMDVIEDF